MVEPVHENAAPEKVDSYMGILSHTSAKEVLDVDADKMTEYGLEPPRARIILTTADGSTAQVFLGIIDQEKRVGYARNSARNQVVPVDLSRFYYLLVANFRNEKLLARIMLSRILSLSIIFPRSPEKNFAIERSAQNRLVFKDDPEVEASPRMSSFVISPFASEDIRFLHQIKPLPLQSYGLDPGRLRIEVIQDDGMSLDVSLGDTVSSKVAVHTIVLDHQRNFIASIPGNLYDMIPMEKEHLKITPKEKEIMERRRSRKQK